MNSSKRWSVGLLPFGVFYSGQYHAAERRNSGTDRSGLIEVTWDDTRYHEHYSYITASQAAETPKEWPLHDIQHPHHGDIKIPKTAKTDTAITSPKVAQSKNEPGILSAYP